MILGGAAVGAYFLMRKATAAGNLVFSPGSISDVGLAGSNPQMILTIIAQNTSNTDLLLNSFAGNLFSNGTLIGNVGNFSQINVPANQATAIPLTVQLFPLGIVTDLITAFQQGSLRQNIVLDALANVNSFQAAVKLNYAIGA